MFTDSIGMYFTPPPLSAGVTWLTYFSFTPETRSEYKFPSFKCVTKLLQVTVYDLAGYFESV